MFKKSYVFFIMLFTISFILLAETTTGTAVASKGSWKDYINIQQIMNILISFLVALLGIATKALSSYLNKLTEQKQAETDNVLLKNAFGFANNLIHELILAESEKVEELIKKVLKDGKVTKEEKKEIVDELTKTALQILGDKGLSHLAGFMGDAKGWIRKRIESFLSMKLSEELERRQS